MRRYQRSLKIVKNRQKSPKSFALVAPQIFAAANTGTMNYFLINFKIKIDHVPVDLKQKFFQIRSLLAEYFKNLQ